MLKIITANSVYHIDDAKKRWARVENNGDTSPWPLRTPCGDFIEHTPVEVGACVILICPPLKEGATARAIITSPVTSWEIIHDN